MTNLNTIIEEEKNTNTVERLVEEGELRYRRVVEGTGVSEPYEFTKWLRTALTELKAETIKGVREEMKSMQNGLNAYNFGEDGIVGYCNPRCHDSGRKEVIDRVLTLLTPQPSNEETKELPPEAK